MPETKFEPWNDPNEKPLIQFKNVTKRFGTFTAIDDQSFDIYAQEFFALLGPSGCGKTTMMRMLAGFETPTEGTILLGGRDIAPIPPNKREVNMMFQSYALFPHLSVSDNIAFGLKRDKLPADKIAARVDEMLKLTRLEKFAGRKPHQISGGQRQRVALARSLAKGPKLLLLDEPLGALDAKLRQDTQFELMDIQEKTGTTFVIVTHDQEEAMTVASRVAVMDDGRIVQIATPDEIYEAPISAYVADFIGDVTLFSGTAMNRTPGAKPVVADASEAEPAPQEAETPETETVETPEAVAEIGVPAEPEAPVASDDVVRGKPKAATEKPAQGPQPNALGLWLHDKVWAKVFGPRTDIVRQLPPPNDAETEAKVPETETVPAETTEIPEGGITIDWAEGQPPLIALDAPDLEDGTEVKLALRPEKIGISKTKPDAVNALKGKVIDIAYLGNLSTYHVELENGTMIKAQLANTRRISRRDITWEDEVWVSWTGTAGVVLTS
ncbi:Spermidine/putrescine import ATP-binding protein PotA [Roseovarius sp. THAF9]|uniref:ABC transporter ATP-binding protein n=1 Tax=Roseovarius sp. THAF9 TaxID=2587847 RepID=UPI00126843C3|nr:ABC transporter ATP-binding protein [Roseovarius sp. THAF9]QFT94909.1 Spermidine/putrescine import ATP-binding protein PotA [Roseovarius sp. THAF9]